jgi:cell division protease FtsH
LSRFPRSSLFYFALVVVLGLVFYFAWQSIQGGQTAGTWTFTKLVAQADSGQVKTLEINGTDAIATDQDNQKHNVVVPDSSGGPAWLTDLVSHTDVSFDKNNSGSYLLSVLLPNIILVILIAAFMWWVLRQTQSGNNQAISFGRSRARLIAGDKPAITFADVAGVEEAKQELTEIVEFLKYAKKNSPCIVFVDEIDAVGRQRGAGLGGGHDEREQTLNQLLVEMDGFDTNTHVIVIAATNRPDVLDPALLRPGRFDRHVTLDRPDIVGRRAILDVHARNKPLDSTVDLDVLARQTPGFSGADLANLINEAAILAARANKKVIGMDELEEAIARVIAGPERKSRRISEKEKEIIAYHETGHALVLRALPHADPVHKVTIISRGMAGGWTMSLPVEDEYLVSRDKLMDEIAGTLGGRVAEEIVFGDITSGAESDIRKVTQLARRMVTQWGMSEKVGTVAMGHREELVFLGRDLGEQRNYSEEVAAMIDEEIRSIINHGYQTAKTILTEQRHNMDAVVERLKVVETLSGKDLDEIIAQANPQAPAATSTAS